MQRQQLHNTIVNFHLQFIDGIFFVEHALGELLVRIQHGMNRLVHSSLGQASHPEQALF